MPEKFKSDTSSEESEKKEEKEGTETTPPMKSLNVSEEFDLVVNNSAQEKKKKIYRGNCWTDPFRKEKATHYGEEIQNR